MLGQYFSVGDGVTLGLLKALQSFADRCWRATSRSVREGGRKNNMSSTLVTRENIT